MADFTYRAAARDGSIATGTLTAPDRTAAFQELDQRKLQPLDLRETGGNQKSRSRIHIKKPALGEKSRIRMKPSEVLHFTEEFSELLKGGIPLESALGIIERREGKTRLPAIAGEVRAKVRDGKSLSESLQTSSPDFGELYCRLVAAGEQSGTLSNILARQAIHLKSMEGLKNRVLSALIYPTFLAVSAIGVAVLFVIYLIPKLMELLDSTGGSLPIGAQIILAMAEFVQGTWYIWVTLGLATFALVGWLSKSRPKSWDRLKLRSPFFGKVLNSRQQVQFLETLATLAGNGLPLVHCLGLTRNVLSSPVYKEEVDAIRAEVEDGALLSKAVSRAPSFPGLMSDLIAVGEQTGDLAGALERAAARFDSDLTRHVDRVSSLIQPAVVVVMAGLVGCMAYLMISAIFQTVSGLGG